MLAHSSLMVLKLQKQNYFNVSRSIRQLILIYEWLPDAMRGVFVSLL